jgi:nucleoside-diphosphate-sugar epimerase
MIFLIGGRGFIGSAFARALDNAGADYAIVDRKSYANYAGMRCRVLINANGNSSKLLARETPIRDFDASVRTVRSTVLDFEAELYVYLSSCDVYPDCSSPLTTCEDLPLDPGLQSPYGFHKRLAEECVRHGAKDWMIFRCGGFVGPGLRKNAIFDILRGGPLWLDPASKLQYMHTSAAADIILKLMEEPACRRQVFNLCGRGAIRLREVVDAMGRTVMVAPSSPCVEYNVSVDKISSWVELPRTRVAVLDFVHGEKDQASCFR